MTRSSDQDTTAKVYVNEEAPFDVKELFFSRTDERGVIKGGNRVFRRVSGYEWDELIGAPHKVIRHKDTPKAVFWLMWNALQSGQPIGAYVKNRAKDGRYYWVYAIAFPMIGEYISARLKPTSALLETVETLYARAIEREQGDGLSPEDSATAFLEDLAKHDFPDYASFMSSALSGEIRSRHIHTRTSVGGCFDQFTELLDMLNVVRDRGRDIVKGFSGIAGAPKNMRVQATRLGAHAAPLGVISTNFDAISTNIQSGIGPFAESLEHVANSLSRALFLNCASSMLAEIIDHFDGDEDREFSEQTLREIDHLKATHPQQTELAEDVVADVMRDLGEFGDTCRALKRTLSGLSIMRVMSEIEAARIGDPTGSMREIILQLHGFQTLAQDSLRVIDDHNDRIARVLKLRMLRRRAA